MNAFPTKKMCRFAVTAGVAAVGVGLTACVGSFNPATDATSPIAPRVQALVDANRTYPRWEDFPANSTDTPAPVEIAARSDALTASGGTLASEAQRLEWTLGDPAEFIEQVTRRVGAVPVSPETARTAAEVDAFAASLRDRAKAPPPIDRR